MSDWSIWDLFISKAYAIPPKTKPGAAKPEGKTPKRTVEKPKVGTPDKLVVEIPPLVKVDSMSNLAQKALISVLRHFQKEYPKLKELEANFMLKIVYDSEKKQYGLVYTKNPANENDLEIKSDEFIPEVKRQEMRKMYYEFFSKLVIIDLTKRYPEKDANPYLTKEGQDTIYTIGIKAVTAEGDTSVPPLVPLQRSKKQLAERVPSESRRAFLGVGFVRGLVEAVREGASVEQTRGAVGNKAGLQVVEEGEESLGIGYDGTRRGFVLTSVLAGFGLWLSSKTAWAIPRKPPKSGAKGAVKKTPGGEPKEPKSDKVDEKTPPKVDEKPSGDKAVVEEAEPETGVPREGELTQDKVDSLLGEHNGGKLTVEGDADLNGLSGKVGYTGPAEVSKVVPKKLQRTETPPIQTSQGLFSGNGLSKLTLSFVTMEVARILPRVLRKSIRWYEKEGRPVSSSEFISKRFLNKGLFVIDVLPDGTILARVYIETKTIVVSFKLNKANYDKYHLLDLEAEDFDTTLKSARNGDIVAFLRLYVYSMPQNPKEEGVVIKSNDFNAKEFIQVKVDGNPIPLRLNSVFMYMMYRLMVQKEGIVLKKRNGKVVLDDVSILFSGVKIPQDQEEKVFKRFERGGKVTPDNAKVEAAEALQEFNERQRQRQFKALYEEGEADDGTPVETETITDVRGRLFDVFIALFDTVVSKEFKGHDQKIPVGEDVLTALRTFFDRVDLIAKDKKNSLHTEEEVSRAIEGHYSSIIYPIVAVLLWELLQEESSFFNPLKLKRTSVVSTGLAAVISSIVSDKLFSDRIRNADSFISEHSLAANAAKDLGIDFITYAASYVLLELLKEGIIS